jgi:pilus assembly protein Flp/PilA
MHRIVKRFAGWCWVDAEHAATAIEYGLIASLIAIAIIVGATALGTNLNGLYNYIAGKIHH